MREAAMTRLSTKHQHLVQLAGCGCFRPVKRRASPRPDGLTRRSFLTGLGAAAITAAMPRTGGAQTTGPAPRILFRQARIFDGKSDALRTGVQILVQGNKIASIDTTNSAPPSDATVINCGDRVLMPGLIDAHWHAMFIRSTPAQLVTSDI